ncbi:hypothetical protein [Nannocystis punicea]|uniref:Lipoprotein n=1 Tax=Nannocystis punicea TaxID=2995304 RepID=A0ABY7HGC6_9BACT|nr:hypothetical protein [Nannocystis poenicansa]WAS98347.1 hypothetical protein O0S08_19575 [Nannocystis poenicansa]
MKAFHCLGGLLLALGCGGEKGDDSQTASGASTTADTSEAESTTSSGSATTSDTTSAASTSTASTTTTESSSGELPPLPEPDPAFCPLDWSGPTTIAGMAPFGAFSGSVSWFEWQFCSGYYPMVLVVEDPAEVHDAVMSEAPIARAIAFGLPTSGWEGSAMTGDFTPEVHAMVDGEWTDLNLSQGEVTLSVSVSVADTESPTDIPRLVGEFSLQGGQGAWDLAGSFDAAYCGPLNDFKVSNCN